ncbi:Protein dennd6a [Phlyctochytrium planicorne]|nr:Protein dennd6a [Phlyctochytrium planicorne]
MARSFSAFPDSNSSAHIGDSVFAFRFRSSELIRNVYSRMEQSSLESLAGEPIPESSGDNQNHSRTASAQFLQDRYVVEEDGFTYGYAFFRQQKDSEIRRGFFQKSLVLLSPHPWPGLFNTVVGAVGPRFMDALIDDRSRMNATSPTSRHAVTSGAKQLLKDICDCFTQWPAPPSKLDPETSYSPTVLSLSILDTSLPFSIPPSSRFPQLFETSPSRSRSATPHADEKQIIISTKTNSARTPQSGLPNDDVDLADHPRNYSGKPGTSNYGMVSSPGMLTPPIISCPGRFYDLFSRSIELLWSCWELIILGEPILVMAETPRGCSDVVWGLVELIKPIPFAGDFRPYFTIQDSDFKEIATRKKIPPTGMIVGVTNPFFTKMFENWPHVIRVARFSSTIQVGPNGSGMFSDSESLSPMRGAMDAAYLGSGSGSTSPNLTPATLASARKKPASPKSPQGSTVKSLMSSFSRNKTPDKAPAAASSVGYFVGEGNALVFESAIQSLTSKYKPFLGKDKKLIKDVVEAAIKGSSSLTLNNMLRRHMVELTDRFLQPLNRYYEGLLVGSPVGMNLSCLRSKPEVNPFKQETFLKSLEVSAPSLPVQSRRSIVELYRLFLKSPNFGLWLQTRAQEINREWRNHYISVICDSDIAQWMKTGKIEEIECVDLLLRIRDEISRYSRYFTTPANSSSNSNDTNSLNGTNSSIRSHSPQPGMHVDNASVDSLPGKPLANQHKHSSRTNFIPTQAQYSRLISQAELLLSLLPEDLSLNVLRQDELNKGKNK